MSFDAYIQNIEKLTGKKPEDFRQEALEDKILRKDMKASELTNWLKSKYGLGHGHAMSLWKYFNDMDWVTTQHTKLK